MISVGTFTKKEHLLKSADFRSVYNKGRSFRRSGFVLSAASNALPYSRLGFSIGSAIIKRAARRNKIRRLFREYYRKNKSVFKTAYDMVIVVRRDPGCRFRYDDAASAFQELAKMAGILI